MRLLLAEDEVSLSKALVTILTRHHYEIDPVYDGQDAYDYLKHGAYDGAILDIMMPKMDGMEVLRRVREEGLSLPILLLTAKSDVDDKVLGLDTGANDYLTKPFDMKELLARIRAMTRKGPQQAEARLRMGNITLDQTTYELTSPFGAFRLSKREYQMMEMLMINRPGFLSPEKLLENIWGQETDTEMSIVWVYISYLRKKLTALQATVQITATRGVGYALEENHD